MIRELPLLAILPLDKLLMHEQYDRDRTPQLLTSLRASGVIRNPPIITPLHDRTSRYMVLDGAHRTLALRSLGLAHILVQIVEPDDPGLQLNPWYHVIWGMDSGDLLKSIREIPSLRLQAREEKTDPQELVNRQSLAMIYLPDGRRFAALSPSYHLETRLRMLHAIVDSYKDHANMDRTNLQDMEALTRLYPRLTGLVVLPCFGIEEILFLVGEGHLLPAGSTRFSISPRALHVNYPLDELAANRSLEEKVERLHQWLQKRIAGKGVRYYAEATFLFDE